MVLIVVVDAFLLAGFDKGDGCKFQAQNAGIFLIDNKIESNIK